MTVSALEVRWAKLQCSNVRYRALQANLLCQNAGPGHRRIMNPPESAGRSYGEGASEEWLAWFAGLKGYYRTMMKFVAGRNPGRVEAEARGISYANERRGARQAVHVFWTRALRQRGNIVQRGPWSMSELQLEILADESTNAAFFQFVEGKIETYAQDELRRYNSYHGHGRGANPLEVLGRTRIRRLRLNQRNLEYGGHLTG